MDQAKDPPQQVKKDHWMLRLLQWSLKIVTPKKYHHWYTKEFFIGWGISGQVTIVQLYALERLFVWLKPFLEPTLTYGSRVFHVVGEYIGVAWKAGKETIVDLLGVIGHSIGHGS